MDRRKKLILILISVIAIISIIVVAAHTLYALSQPLTSCVSQHGNVAVCPVTTTPLG